MLEDLAVVFCGVFAVVHSCHGLLGSQRVCQHAAGNVLCLFRSYGNEQVGVCHSSLFQSAYAGGRGVHYEQVVVSPGHFLGLVGVLVHEYDIVILL